MQGTHRDQGEAALRAAREAVAAAEPGLTAALAAADVMDAVELAEQVEQLARLVHRWQVRAAGAVEAESPAVRPGEGPPEVPFRRGCDLLRSRLRISGREAARRIRAAGAVLPRPVMSGGVLAPLASVAAAGIGITPVPAFGVVDIAPGHGAEGDGDGDGGGVSGLLADAPGPEALEVVLRTLQEVGRVAPPEVVAEAEVTMVEHAATFDPETLRRVGRRLVHLLDPDGVELDDRVLRSRQGVKVGARWHGLTHLDIWADPVQTEILMTVFDTGTNPRPHGATQDRAEEAAAPANPTDQAATPEGLDAEAGADTGGPDVGANAEDRSADGSDSEPVVDDRHRGQRMLDALVSACHAALRSGTLPRIGGLPPQVLVTIGLEDLRADVTSAALARTRHRRTAGPEEIEQRDPGPPGHTPDSSPTSRDRHPRPIHEDPRAPRTARTGRGNLPHAGPVAVSSLRRLACDADLIPVVLGTAGDVVDVGRAHRLVPASMRRALIARDAGCIFPGCTIPATWTEAHHITPWSHGGPTSTANTTLLCPAHHHAVHRGRWVIEPDTTPSPRPFRVTSPWTARPHHTWNAYPRGA
ncbi:HNH endonuclease signature motif containing protein [Litorihabitans aurantiacus]|uniref:HNH nuclease domain-containing protein n=1 Tax=Litorihabitans aurantiacus TaxID=1930061 RepID=A0AA37XDJ0_9MICO|nr:HNH endonuclease signature motif containing protein [Litorihabitans aurantiacus]GMA31290.1 hypothetical protein GCM10025875_12820 [Litorihabitans aurantiacus]